MEIVIIVTIKTQTISNQETINIKIQVVSTINGLKH